ncbi:MULTISPECIES: type IVB secretion system protein IcmH/DotU [unclassified Modicisalibacter]|uniref:type IVB secretion system protein IcmH/DotU n=1 Tax=unclassified Modicisalibacter TaxID=2679913 RepID=UPI001CCA429C|nr:MULTISPECIES: type IVB secretion system protein IcmH/DotU [unclassified Modicisalibacter]MBZ9556814.1 type IVB secretion system protein IcmH/DotU [Modicisalibacter sp. R2A 31.J]MBZ9574716.1 type IVB secretion system protein IcmH/DotU [Modicisalibacter sp. MOD 31.J]
MTEALAPAPDSVEPRSLKTLTRDFIAMVLMVRRGQQAESVERFLERVDRWFEEFEEKARAQNYSADAVKDVQYALCAFLDESVLKAGSGNIREHIELHPLQYRHFGVHLAGEGFYDRLDSLRGDVRGNLDVLEVYHLCLALGFEGKYSLENRDQLRYIANTLGHDIARYRKRASTQGDSWKLPDQVGQMLRYEIPLWVYLAGIVGLCLAVYAGLDWWLGSETDALIEQIRDLFTSTP